MKSCPFLQNDSNNVLYQQEAESIFDSRENNSVLPPNQFGSLLVNSRNCEKSILLKTN